MYNNIIEFFSLTTYFSPGVKNIASWGTGMICWLLSFFIMYLSLIHVQTLHEKYVNHVVVHSDMWGNLHVCVCACILFFFSWKHLSWRHLQKTSILLWPGLVAKWHSGIPFHNHKNVLWFMHAESPASWVPHIPLFSPMLGKISWFREPAGLWFENWK